MFNLNQGFAESKNVKYSFNVGSLFDIPTGHYLTGKYGESILNGGLGFMTGIVGIGNSFKSTVLNYLVLSAVNRIFSTVETSISTYDTEVNISEFRLNLLIAPFEYLRERDIIDAGIWSITDKTVYYANEWYTKAKEFLNNKSKIPEKEYYTTPFLDRDKKTLVKILPPTFGGIDSLSAFETSDIADIQNKNEIGDSATNMIDMRASLAKSRFLSELPTVCAKYSHYLLMTAHLGKEMQVASGPFAAPPPQKLATLKHNDKIKGVSDKFFFLITNVWHSYSTVAFINQGTKGPEYPYSSEHNKVETPDLYLVRLRSLRSKNGLSNITLELVVSQTEGVLGSLSEYNFIKNIDRFGISGTPQSSHLDIYPEVSFSRTTIRSLLKSNPTLERAVNITSELGQIFSIWSPAILDPKYLCTPQQLYDDLIKLGYDWNVLLNTRGWWTFNNDKHPIPFLSTLDLLKMRKEEYFPYWLEKDKKTIKKEFVK